MSGPPPSKTAWAYLRVSTDKQDIENQRIQISRFAEVHGFTVPPGKWFEDEAVHGTTPAIERKGYLDLHDQLERTKGKAPGSMPRNILMYEVSRLGRTFWETLDAIRFLEDLSPILSTSPNESFMQIEDKSIRQLVLMVMAWVAEKELANLRQRVRDGVVRAKKEEKHFGNKHLGYYQWDHEENCRRLDHGFGSEEKNKKFCPLRGKEFSGELGKRAYRMLQMDQGLKAVELQRDLGIGYKTAWNLLKSVKKLGLLVPPEEPVHRRVANAQAIAAP